MRTFSFGPEHGRQIDRFGSDFLISRLAHTPEIHVACMRLGPGGQVGFHQATTYQLFVVIEGEGWVRSESPHRTPIRAGEAAFWLPNEWHAAGTEAGMVAIVVEGAGLGGDPGAVGPTT